MRSERGFRLGGLRGDFGLYLCLLECIPSFFSVFTFMITALNTHTWNPPRKKGSIGTVTLTSNTPFQGLTYLKPQYGTRRDANNPVGRRSEGGRKAEGS